MRTYIYSIVCMAAVGGIVLIVSPDGIRSGIKKHMRLICSLCMLCVMISPIGEILNGINDIGNKINDSDEDEQLHGIYESIYESKSDEGYNESIGKSVKAELNKKMSVPEKECRVSVEFSDTDQDGFREPRKITVILSGSSVFMNPRQVERFVAEKFGCECVCAIE